MISNPRNIKLIAPLRSFIREIDKTLDPKHIQKYRALRPDQLEELKKNNNRAENWGKVFVHPKFKTDRIFNVTFYGTIHLGDFSGSIIVNNKKMICGIDHSTLIDVNVGNHCLISNCSLIQNVHIENHVRIVNCGSITHTRELPYLPEICLGNELGGRKIKVFPGIKYQQVVELSLNRNLLFQKSIYKMFESFSKYSLKKTILASHCSLTNNTAIENVYLKEGTVLSGCTEIKNSLVLSNCDSPSSISNGCILRNSIIENNVHIDSSAIVESSYMFEASSTSHQAIINQSVIGCNSHIEKGEVTSSLIGPFVGFHHQSLLISVLWPQGKGNVGYGAKIGSNHSGKAPDQECILAEGIFFGIGASVKFPANLSNAPFSLIAPSVTLSPQKIEFPFSLIMESGNTHNEIIPGWVWKYNRYMLRRNEIKYFNRNKASENICADILQPATIDCILNAIKILIDLKNKHEDITSGYIDVGLNSITPINLNDAIHIYSEIIELYCLKSFYEAFFDNSHQLKSLQGLLKKDLKSKHWYHARKIFKKHVQLTTSGEILSAYLNKIKEEISQVKKSKDRDLIRGKEIFDDYELVHSPVNQDDVVKNLKAYTKEVEYKMDTINSL